MKVLLVNDDGYGKPGLEALARVFGKRGDDVFIVAPSGERSGFSHSFSLGRELEVCKHGNGRYSISGTPADAVVHAIRSTYFLPEKPDLVVSGINRGYNIALDIIYSGTCGAAREAVVSGVKGIAISSELDGYEEAARYLCENIDSFLSVLDDEHFLNINVPLSFNGKGVVTIPGKVEYIDKVEIRKDGEKEYLKLVGLDRMVEHYGCVMNDTEAVDLSYASVSLVPILPRTSDDAYEKLRKAMK